MRGAPEMRNRPGANRTAIRKGSIEPHDIAETAADRQARKLRRLFSLRLDVRNAIATAKIAEFENQSHRLGHVIATGLLGRVAAADLLLDVATSHSLVHEHGDDFIQQIMAEGLNCEAHQ